MKFQPMSESEVERITAQTRFRSAPTAVTKEEYMRIKMEQEASAFLAEFKVNRELNHKPTDYEWADGSEIRHQKIADLVIYADAARGVVDDKSSIARIATFLRSHNAPERKSNGWVERDSWTGQIRTTRYVKQHEDGYSQYVEGFQQDREMLIANGWLGKGF